MQPPVIVYTVPQCPSCEAVKRHLTARGVSYRRTCGRILPRSRRCWPGPMSGSPP
ncbi:glutaredoxin domain-containing protein [Deinococcus humi]|uniref:glutaredoxin domain-containing protein n=1 Tax=Deinococcus humi TaxID=662880 RepID=UPI00314553D6